MAAVVKYLVGDLFAVPAVIGGPESKLLQRPDEEPIRRQRVPNRWIFRSSKIKRSAKANEPYLMAAVKYLFVPIPRSQTLFKSLINNNLRKI